MKVVIMAGGKGTRISSIANSIPKPMIKIFGKPVLEYEIECLKEQGFVDIIITVGHLGKVIVNYFGDGSNISPVTGKSFGVNIDYFIEKEPLGNAGALFKIKEKLSEDFILLNADSIFNIDFTRFVDFHKKNKALATILTHPNNHPFDSSLIITDHDGYVTNWISKEEERPKYYKNCTNAGIHIISPKALDNVKITEKIDLDRQILKPLANHKKMISYKSSEYIKDMGTPERFALVCNDFLQDRIESKNFKNKQKAIFLDRDGTINELCGFLKKIEDFNLLPGVSDAIKYINNIGYLAIVITNQPIVARGELTIRDLEKIHKKMEMLLGDDGAYLDDIYFCPHHKDKGFKGEIVKLKIDCECRKPKPGMLLKAAEYYNVDLSESWMVGDSKNDIEAGINAGCKTALIGNGNFGQTISVSSLLDFVEHLDKYLKGEKNGINKS